MLRLDYNIRKCYVSKTEKNDENQTLHLGNVFACKQGISEKR